MIEQRITGGIRRRFADHKATVVLQNDDIFVLDWKNRDGSGAYYIRYIVDTRMGSLVIQGDTGSAIACWHNPVTPEEMARLVSEPGYFSSKIQCPSDIYSFTMEDVREDLDSYVGTYLLKYLDPVEDRARVEEIREICSKLLHELDEDCYCDDGVYSDYAVTLLHRLDSNWWDGMLSHLGRRIGMRVYFWSIGFRMAMGQLTEGGNT